MNPSINIKKEPGPITIPATILKKKKKIKIFHQIFFLLSLIYLLNRDYCIPTVLKLPKQHQFLRTIFLPFHQHSVDYFKKLCVTEYIFFFVNLK